MVGGIKKINLIYGKKIKLRRKEKSIGYRFD
jgi:hypothetical protein